MGLDLFVVSLIGLVINIYIILLFVRMFLVESERYDALLGMVFRATDPVVAPLGTALRSRRVDLATALGIVVLLLLKGMIWGSIPRTLQSFADTLFTIYVFIIIIIAGYREYYTNPIASFGQRMVNPVRAIAANFSRSLTAVNILSVVLLVILHSIVTLILDSMTGVMGTVSVKAAVLNSLSMIIDLTRYFVYIIIINALLSWVSPDPLNPVVQLLALVSAPIIEPIRRVVPPIAGAIDISPMIAIFLLIIANNIGHQVLSLFV
jgi:YggT family protein